VDPGHLRPDLVGGGQAGPQGGIARGVRAQRPLAAVHGDGAQQRPQAVAEPPVDAALGGEEQGHRLLAAFVDVAQLAAHQRGEHAPAAVRGQHADRGDARDRADPPGQCGLEGEQQRGADDPVAVEGGERALQVDDGAQRLDASLGGQQQRLAEGLAEFGELGLGHGTDRPRSVRSRLV